MNFQGADYALAIVRVDRGRTFESICAAADTQRLIQDQRFLSNREAGCDLVPEQPTSAR
jgi:hypothetical protein